MQNAKRSSAFGPSMKHFLRWESTKIMIATFLAAEGQWAWEIIIRRPHSGVLLYSVMALGYGL